MLTLFSRSSRSRERIRLQNFLRVTVLHPGKTFPNYHEAIVSLYLPGRQTSCFDSAFKDFTRSPDFPDCPCCPTTLAMIRSTNSPDFSPTTIFDNCEYSSTSLRLIRQRFIENSLVLLNICSIFS